MAKPHIRPKLQTTSLREAVGLTIDADEAQWRRLSGDAARDLAPLTQSRMIELAAYLWESNLLADRLVELPVAYLLAEGVTLTAADEDDQAALDAFWAHPLNRMDLRLEQMVRELSLFGEQVYPVFSGPGGVRLASLDPSLIEAIVTDPDDPGTPIVLRTVKDGSGRAREYRIIYNGPEALFGTAAQRRRAEAADGECFYYAIRRLSAGRRGRSDLLAPADWLDAYDRFLFGELDRTDFLRAFVWDVTLAGANAEAVKSRAQEITAPKPGSVRVHNDAETWAAVAPTLNSADVAETARLMRNHVLGGATIPEHWFGGGGDVNRSTGESMGEPTLKMLSMRQRLWRAILVDIGTYVVRARRHLLGAPITADLGIEAQFPELTARDTTRWAAALQQVATAVGLLLDRGLWTEERALRAIEDVASRLGTEVDPAELLTAAQAEAAARAERDVFTTPPDPAADPAPSDAP